MALDVAGFGFVARCETDIGRHVERRGKEIHNRVEKRLNAFVLEGGTGGDRNKRQCQRALADQRAERFLVGLVALEVGFHGGVVHVDGDFDQVGAHFFGAGLQIGADRLTDPGGAKVFTLPNPLFHLDQIDDAFELVFCADRKSDRGGDRTGPVLDHANTVVKVCADLVHLVDEDDTRNLVAVGLTPDGFGLGFDTGVGVEQADSTIENRKRTLDFDGEVNVAGGVDDVETDLGVRGAFGGRVFLALPESGRGSRGDRDAAFLFLLHPVHGRGAVVDFADLVGLAGVIEDPLGRGGLARIDVGHDPEVPIPAKGVFACHVSGSLPAVMAERFVRVGHLVGVFPLLHRGAATVDCIEQLAGKALFHGVFVAVLGSRDQPADRKGLTALGADFDGDLIGGTTNPARTNFDARFDVVEGFVEHLDRGFLQAALDAFESAVDDALGDRFLAVDHQVVHEFRNHAIAIFGIGQDFAFFGSVTTRHCGLSLLRTLGAVFRTTLLTVLDTLGIEDTAQDVITDARKVFYTAATDQNHRVFLKVVAFTRNVADDLETVGQAHLGDFPHGRVRLLGGGGVDAGADTTLLGAGLEVLRLGLRNFGLPRLADQLLDRWHWVLFPILHMCSGPVGPQFRFACPARPQQHKKPAVDPLPEDRCGGFSEDQGSISPDHDHDDSDIGHRGNIPGPGWAAYRGSREGCQQPRTRNTAITCAGFSRWSVLPIFARTPPCPRQTAPQTARGWRRAAS